MRLASCLSCCPPGGHDYVHGRHRARICHRPPLCMMRQRCACDRSCRPLQRLSTGLRPFLHCGAYILRGLLSKTQINAVTAHRSPVLLELQPLARKGCGDNGNCTSSRHRHGRQCDRRIKALPRCACPPLSGRGWHLHKRRSGELVVVRGSSRPSGSPLPPLGVHMIHARCELGRADCRLRRRNNADNHMIVATCARFFEYLMPEYAAEFVALVHAHVHARLRVGAYEPPPALVAHWVGLQ